jgi:hypothetical protein
MCAPYEHAFVDLGEDVDVLTEYAIGPRYPSDDFDAISAEEARSAVQRAERVSKRITDVLGLRLSKWGQAGSDLT